MTSCCAIYVEVAYARAEEQAVVPLTVAKGTTVGQAVNLSGLLERFPEIDLSRSKVGIFGELTSLDRLLQAHDRVEIYRPLCGDPRELRRRRIAQGRGRTE
jgi:putative ubiquitin-RnfH superfamily antitoxin RatB of RatAB toxin-antitoxin module